MKPADWKIWIAECDAHVRAGRLHEGAAMLSIVEVKEIPREYRLPVAGLCRRANLLNIGLRILTPIVHERQGAAIAKATIEEWAEYAVLLQRSGGVREALNILSRPGMDSFTQPGLYRAYCHFNLWEYAEAIPHLQAYVARENAEYPRLIGGTNLAAAYIFAGRRMEGATLALANAKAAGDKGNVRLQCNNLELLAQSHFETGNYKEARGVIGNVSDLLSGSGTIDQLYIRKWNAALDAVEQVRVSPLLEFRAEALRARHFESVREADLLTLKIQFSEEKFKRLYFGTPFPKYRERIEKILGHKAEGDHYACGTGEARLDLQTGELIGLPVEFPVGTKVHQCLEIIMRDLYKPFSVGAMFSELFPGEYFDIDSSPNRVHQAVSRTRQWLQENDFPMELTETDGRYSLSVQGNLQIVIGRQAQLCEWEAVQMVRLKRICPAGATLTAGRIREVLALTPANFKRFSAWALETGALVKSGSRAATKYKMPTADESQSARAA